MKNIVLFFAVILFLSACEKTVYLDLDQSKPKVVIEGMVTDRAEMQFVKVSRSSGFYSNGGTPKVTDATVVVEDDLGNSYNFVHNPNGNEDSLGIYLPEVPFSGVIGRTYKLTVMVDGKSYEGSDTMYRLVPIDKLESRIDEDEEEDPEDPGRFYELRLWVKEPKDTRDYYLFKNYRNGELAFDADTDIYYADDEFIGENIDGVSLPVFYAKDDVAEIVVYSLSREAFIFYRDLDKLLNGDGGMFSPPPANPRTNLSNDAVGFFQVSAVQSGELTIGQ
jgi:hypothetical protein